MKNLFLFLLVVLVKIALPQTVNFITPAPGDIWNTGTTQNITWASQGVTTVNIRYSPDGINWQDVSINEPATDGSFSWDVAGTTSPNGLLSIADSADHFTGDTVQLILGPTFTLSIMGDTAVCTGQPVQLKTTTTIYNAGSGVHSGGPPPPPPVLTVHYIWMPGTGIDQDSLITANPLVIATTTTTYTVTAYDDLGDTVRQSVTVFVHTIPNVQLLVAPNYLMTAGILNNDTNLTYKFDWSNGVTQYSNYIASTTAPVSGYYCVTVTDITAGCIGSRCDTVGCPNCVWPGDANNDGVADNNDFLLIGLAYDATGIARLVPPQNQNDWMGQYSLPWADTLPNGENYKYIDCNGDGTINANDTVAIIQNYGLTHLKSEKANKKGGAPQLIVSLSPDTSQAGQTVTATFTLGDVNNPATNVYGLAFDINYDTKVVDSTQTNVSIGNSWIGSSTDMISMSKDLRGQGVIKMALTRIDHTVRSGYGMIASASFVITTDNINGKNLSYFPFTCHITNISANDNVGVPIDIDGVDDTASVAFTPTGIKETALSREIQIFPNPTKNQLTIENYGENRLDEIRITDLLGNTIITYNNALSNRNVIPVSYLSAGSYFVRIFSNGEVATKSFVIAR